MARIRIVDTIYTPDGGLFTGRVYAQLAYASPLMSDRTLAAVPSTHTVTNGAFDATLEANSDIVPEGTSYQITFHAARGIVWRETWVIPATDAVTTVRAVRVIQAPAPAYTVQQGPKGDTGAIGATGAAATVSVGAVTTGVPGSAADVENSGNEHAAVLDFTIPRGDTGAKGDQGIQGIQGVQGSQGLKGDKGDAATVAVGTTSTGAPGSSASVANSGAPGAAVFNFTIPRGDVGPAGPGYTLPVATVSVLGGVKVSSDLTVDVNGLLSLPVANAQNDNCALAGIAEIFSQLGGVSSYTSSQIAAMQAQITAAVAALDPNTMIAGIKELLALVGMVPDSVWRAETAADGGLLLPLSLRVNGRTMFAVPTTAPTDSDIPNGFAAPWLNEATDKLTFRIRRSNGALITKEI
jgi:hypothetical protein